MAPKQFRAPRDTRPPLEFEITYSRLIKGEWEEQTDKFRARPMIAGNMMLRMAATMDSPGIGLQSGEMIKLLDGAIWPEDKKRFMALLDDNDTAIPIDTLGEILMWLVEEYAEHPTQRP